MNKPETEYYLGRNDRNGYTIVEHNSRRPPYEGCCVFGICDYWISDGDGTPMKYDDTIVSSYPKKLTKPLSKQLELASPKSQSTSVTSIFDIKGLNQQTYDYVIQQ